MTQKARQIGDPLLKVEGVNLSFGGIKALQAVDDLHDSLNSPLYPIKFGLQGPFYTIKVHPGEIVLIIFQKGFRDRLIIRVVCGSDDFIRTLL